jgi:nitroimidazol reductase NimA-like FMN-containing flavoprotein (pyridoxamine 5'-phosphate oxidase superfamily)
MADFPVGELNKVRRGDRASYDRAAIHALLDEAMEAHVGFIDAGRPVVIPMIYGRVDELLYLHGAKATRFAKAMAPGLPVCLTVTVLDGIVVGRSAFHMSMNYRSAVIHGHASLVTDGEEAERALAAITDHALPGRWSEVRPMLDKEAKATAARWSACRRTRGLRASDLGRGCPAWRPGRPAAGRWSASRRHTGSRIRQGISGTP